MEVRTNSRGYMRVVHPTHQKPDENHILVLESSVVGNYPDAEDYPGSSSLWVAGMWHLNREEVRTLCGFMAHWLEHKRLPTGDTPLRIPDSGGPFICVCWGHDQQLLVWSDERGYSTDLQYATIYESRPKSVPPNCVVMRLPMRTALTR